MFEMRSAKICVIIPAYNASWCIGNAIKSVINQTYDDFEIVIVNDGSTDSTQEIVEFFIESYPKHRLRLINQENKRLGAARNSGIEATDSELIAFLDADDVWYPEKLKRVSTIMDSLNHDVGVVCNDELAVGEGFKEKVLRYGPYKSNMFEYLLMHGNRLSPSAVTVRRSVLGDLRFSEDPGFHSIEDYDLWLELSKLTKFYFLHEVLGEYRLYSNSLSSDVTYNLKNTINVLEKHFQAYDNTNCFGLLNRIRKSRRIGVVYRQASKRSLDAENFGLAKKYFLSAFLRLPGDIKCFALGMLIMYIITLNGLKEKKHNRNYAEQVL